MNKYVSENVFLINAGIILVSFPLAYIAYYVDGSIIGNKYIVALFAALFYIQRQMKPFLQEKEKYEIDKYPLELKVLAGSIILSGVMTFSMENLVNQYSILQFFQKYPLWSIHLLRPIEYVVAHRNYVNGIEVKKYDFWSQEERKKKEQEKREKKERYKNKTEEK